MHLHGKCTCQSHTISSVAANQCCGAAADVGRQPGAGHLRARRSRGRQGARAGGRPRRRHLHRRRRQGARPRSVHVTVQCTLTDSGQITQWCVAVTSNQCSVRSSFCCLADIFASTAKCALQTHHRVADCPVLRAAHPPLARGRVRGRPAGGGGAAAVLPPRAGAVPGGGASPHARVGLLPRRRRHLARLRRRPGRRLHNFTAAAAAGTVATAGGEQRPPMSAAGCC
jgi:hypothetical protein